MSGTTLSPREGIRWLPVDHVPSLDPLTVAAAQGHRRGWTTVGEGQLAGPGGGTEQTG